MVDKATAQHWEKEDGDTRPPESHAQHTTTGSRKTRSQSPAHRDENVSTNGEPKKKDPHALTLEDTHRTSGETTTHARTWQQHKGGCLHNTTHPLPRGESAATTKRKL